MKKKKKKKKKKKEKMRKYGIIKGEDRKFDKQKQGK
jgi:hypothetical protein